MAHQPYDPERYKRDRANSKNLCPVCGVKIGPKANACRTHRARPVPGAKRNKRGSIVNGSYISDNAKYKAAVIADRLLAKIGASKEMITYQLREAIK